MGPNPPGATRVASLRAYPGFHISRLGRSELTVVKAWHSVFFFGLPPLSNFRFASRCLTLFLP